MIILLISIPYNFGPEIAFGFNRRDTFQVIYYGRFNVLKKGDMDANSKVRGIKITGYVIATDFTRQGRVSEIVLETEYFQQYIITPNQKGKELFDLLYSKVTIHGVISGEDVHGNKIIKIDEYNINDRVQLISD